MLTCRKLTFVSNVTMMLVVSLVLLSGCGGTTATPASTAAGEVATSGATTAQSAASPTSTSLTFTPEEEAYVQAVAALVNESMGSWGTIFALDEKSETTPEDSERGTAALAAIIRQNETAKTLRPPANMQGPHGALLEAMDSFAQAADLQKRGMETGDMQLAIQSQGSFQRGAEAMDRWQEQMQPWVAILEPLLKLPEE